MNLRYVAAGMLAAGLALGFAPGARAGCSTINPAAPGFQGPLISAPVRQNFAAAANDINSIIGEFAGALPPANPCAGQLWRNTALNPEPISAWDGTTWVPVGLIDVGLHLYYPYLGGSPLGGTQPANEAFASPNGSAGPPGWRALVPNDIPALSLLNGSITAAQMLALPQYEVYQGNSSGQPAAVTLSAGIDAALGNTQGDILVRTASGWQAVAASGDVTLSNTGAATVGSLEGGNISLPTVTSDTLATLAATQTLTSKTISCSANTCTNLPAGNLTGSGTLPIAVMPNSGVTAGSYNSANITVDATGRVTAAANGGGGVPSYVTAGAVAALRTKYFGLGGL